VKKDNVRDRLFATTVLAGLAFTGFAHAQAPVQTTQPAAPAAAEEEDEAIVVTGSRIARQDFTAISPVTSVGAQDIELSATLSVEQLLNELPQVIPGNTVTSNNAGGEDFATIDLRGLGPSRTLVLVDGERVPSASTTGAVDINSIPVGLIERIEVVTGGASAVYGSDAIAGVVNFILKRDYEGAELRFTAGSAEDGNGQFNNVDFLLGGNFADGRGNVTTYGSWFNREGVKQSAYDYSRVSAALVYGYDLANSAYTGVDVADSAEEYLASLARFRALPNGIGGTFSGGGSATPPWGQISSNAANPFRNLSTNPLTSGNFASANTDCNPSTAGVAVNGGTLSFNDQGQLTPYFSSSACAVPIRANGSSRYNFAPDNFIFLPAERMGIQTFINYKLTDDIDMRVMLSYVDTTAEVQLAATPITGLSIPVSSPSIVGADGIINTADDPHRDLSAALLSRPDPAANFTYAWRSNGVGPRVGTFENSSLITRLSLTGPLPGGWEWAASLGFGQVDFDSELKNNVNRVALLQGLAGCANVPATARLPACVNVDIFGPTATTAAMSSFVRTDVKTTSRIEQSSLSGYVRGDLFSLPAGPVSAVFGLEYRDDEGDFIVDDAQRRGEIAGFNAQQSVFGNQDVLEAYGEVAIPFLAELPFAHYLGIELGYRVSDYSTIGEANSYKIAGEYAPVSWLTFRGTFNAAIRAPSLLEGNQAGDQGFPSFTDPCRATATASNAALRTFCTTNGSIGSGFVPASIAGTFAANNSQVQAFAFGNPNLEAEEAETTTLGLVFEPDFLPIGELAMSVDYYDIQLEKAIVGRGAQTILNSCYLNLGGSAQSASDCRQIVRDPATGQVDSVNTSLVNGIGTIQTKGYDVSLEYNFDLDELFAGVPGNLSFDGLYTFVDSYDFLGTEIVGTTSAGIGGATPDFKAVNTVQYEVGDWLFQARHTFVPGLQQTVFGPAADASLPETPELSNLDLSARWDLNDRLRLTLNVDNVFNEFPPQTASGVFDQGNTDAALYAPWVIGRIWTVSGRIKF